MPLEVILKYINLVVVPLVIYIVRIDKKIMCLELKMNLIMANCEFKFKNTDKVANLADIERMLNYEQNTAKKRDGILSFLSDRNC